MVGFTEDQLKRLRYWRQRELWKFELVLRHVTNYLQTHDYYTLALVNWDEVFAEIDKVPDPDKPNPDVTEADLIVLEANFLGDRGLTQEELEKLDGLDANRAQLHRLLQSLSFDDLSRCREWVLEQHAQGIVMIDTDVMLQELKIKPGELRFGEDVCEAADFMNEFRPTPIVTH